MSRWWQRRRRGGWTACSLVFFACWALAAPAWAQGVAYLTRIRGIEDPELLERVEGISRLKSEEQNPPATMSALRKRVRDDLERISKLLRSEGYFDHALGARVDTEKVPYRVRIRVDPGPAYALKDFDVEVRSEDLEAAIAAVERARAGLSLGGRARAADILRAEDAVLRELRREGFPYPRAVKRDVVVDHAERSVRVVSKITTGPRARFGPVHIDGVHGPIVEYVKRRLPWREGDVYNPDLLETLRTRLAATGLFASVRVRPASEVPEDRSLPVTVALERGKARTVGAGVRYSSSEGVGGSAYWEHRNIFGRAERLRLTGEITQLGESAKLTFRKPDFFSTDQVLVFDASYDIEDTEAFDSEKIKTSLGIERPLTKRLTLLAGAAFERGPVEGTGESDRTVVLVGLPAGLRFDLSNDFLNPTRGLRTDLSVTPYVRELGSDVSFARSRVAQSFYWPFDRDARFVGAARAALGSIVGANRSAVPPDKRFYAGGGGSVRGYEFQRAGPLDPTTKDPIGGRSLVEVGAELRWRVNRHIGLVPFVDGGTVYESSYPSFDDNLFWGAGLGVRYYSPIGPLRLDIATPLNPRRKIDEPVQFYLSLGQAF